MRFWKACKVADKEGLLFQKEGVTLCVDDGQLLIVNPDGSGVGLDLAGWKDCTEGLEECPMCHTDLT